MALQLPFPPLSSSSSLPLLSSSSCKICTTPFSPFTHQRLLSPSNLQNFRFQRSSRGRTTSLGPLFVSKEDTQLTSEEETSTSTVTQEDDDDPDPESLEYVSQIKRALDLLKRNRDMLFGEVKLTIMIEDPRDVERRRLLGIDDENAPTRDDLAACLEEINEGKVPKDRVALQMLAEEMNSWPNLEVEATKQNKSRSLYAKATDTGIDPKEAAKRLKIDWDSAAEIEEAADSDEPDVPPALNSDMPSFMDLQESEFPVSLKESTSTHPKSHHLTIPLPVPPSKKFLSNSLPNSANSSPRFASKKKCNKNQNNQPSPLSRQHSVALANLERLKEDHLRRSKSCGEGRSSAPLEKLTNVKHVEENRVVYQSSGGEDKAESIIDQKFKCGAMCLFIPGLGKAKQVRAKRVETEIVLQHDMEQQHNVSRKVSLEKFECGSWTSSAIINDEENDDYESKNLFFDLPIELIQCSDGDKDMNCSPVTTAFVFDKEPKGVLKNNSSTPKTADRKSNESSTTRHVRFSTSSPDSGSPTSCMTPRLRKARDDFNALLEAQCA